MEDIKKVDPNSQEFQGEFINTVAFTDEVLKNHTLEYNPDGEIVEGIRNGLTRNQLIYGKKYCPCFFVTENEEENRLCPCKPALSSEIPEKGQCHCGIFCTPEHAQELRVEETAKTVAHNHSRGLTKEECELLVKKEQLDTAELESLIEARELGMVDFLIVDVREWMEYQSARIKGVDELIPTTSFYETIPKIEDKKETPIIVYCHVGSRSAYCQRVMKDLGFAHVGNLTYGIISYQGEIDRG